MDLCTLDGRAERVRASGGRALPRPGELTTTRPWSRAFSRISRPAERCAAISVNARSGFAPARRCPCTAALRPRILASSREPPLQATSMVGSLRSTGSAGGHRRERPTEEPSGYRARGDHDRRCYRAPFISRGAPRVHRWSGRGGQELASVVWNPRGPHRQQRYCTKARRCVWWRDRAPRGSARALI